jgi:putative SOS response-associated peptidase YedK
MLVAVRNQSGKRILQQMRWRLIPWWAKDIKVGFSSINARAETVDTTRVFRDAWKNGQRRLVITDGFYEWKKPEKQRIEILDLVTCGECPHSAQNTDYKNTSPERNKNTSPERNRD